MSRREGSLTEREINCKTMTAEKCYINANECSDHDLVEHNVDIRRDRCTPYYTEQWCSAPTSLLSATCCQASRQGSKVVQILQDRQATQCIPGKVILEQVDRLPKHIIVMEICA